MSPQVNDRQLVQSVRGHVQRIPTQRALLVRQVVHEPSNDLVGRDGRPPDFFVQLQHGARDDAGDVEALQLVHRVELRDRDDVLERVRSRTAKGEGLPDGRVGRHHDLQGFRYVQ